MERHSLIRTFILAAVCSALIVAAPAAADSAGLVGSWRLDEGQGTLAVDSSGFGNNGNVEGNATWVPGHSGTALSFDGSGGGGVQVPDSSSLEPSSAVTVTAWVRSSGSPGTYRYILAKGATGCTAASYGLYTGPSGGLRFYVSTKHGTIYRTSPDSGDAIWNAEWHLITGTYDGATVRLYVDGVQVGAGTQWSQPLEYTLSDSNDLFIGDYPGCTAHGFRGAIDEVTVWNRALSAAEIAAAASGPQPTSPPSIPPPKGTPPTPTRQSPSPGTSGGTPGGAPQTKPTGQEAPELMFLNLVPAMFSIRAGSTRSGTTISYTATQPGMATVTVLRARPGILKRGHCVKPIAVRSGHPRSCTQLAAVGSFRHANRVGRNRFRFTGLRDRKLTPGRYVLVVTPRAHGKTGEPLAATFWVLP